MQGALQLERGRLLTAWTAYRGTYFAALAPKTRQEYKSALRRALQGLPETFGAAELMAWHRRTMLAELGYSPRYANFCLGVLRTVARRAAPITRDEELSSVLWQVPPVREVVRAPRCPPDDFLRRALELATNKAERAFLLLAGLAGLRRGELLGLRPGDWHHEDRVLWVVRQRGRDCRKNGRPHSVTVDDPELARCLDWTVSHADALRSRQGCFTGRSDGYLFPWGARRVLGLLARIRGALGPEYLPRGWGWHAFRHWGASELARSGSSILEIQAWLGDADPDMACLYVAMVRGQTSSSVSRLASRLRGKTKSGKRKG